MRNAEGGNIVGLCLRRGLFQSDVSQTRIHADSNHEDGGVEEDPQASNKSYVHQKIILFVNVHARCDRRQDKTFGFPSLYRVTVPKSLMSRLFVRLRASRKIATPFSTVIPSGRQAGGSNLVR